MQSLLIPTQVGRQLAARSLFAFFWSTLVSAGVPVLDCVMDHEPALPVQRVEYQLPEDWRGVWQAALRGPEEDLRRETAEAITRAQRAGCSGLEEFHESLRSALASSTSATVRLTIANALIELNAAGAAPELYALLQTGGDRDALFIEPALAHWNYDPMRAIWLERLAQPRSVSRSRLLLAIRGVQGVRESRAEQALRRIALDNSHPAGIRLAAAEAAGALQTGPLSDEAQTFAADVSPNRTLDRLVAIHLLGDHQDEPVQELLLEYAVDQQSVVSALALRKLLAIDPMLVHSLSSDLLSRAAADVRLLVAQSLFERPSIGNVNTLVRLLNDPHRDVRVYARESLQDLEKQAPFEMAVIEGAVAILATDDWRGLEQSARLLGEVNHLPAAARLVALLEHERPEVSVTAAWSLRRLAVSESLPGMLDFAEHAAAEISPDPQVKDGGRLTPEQDACLSHLFEAFGLMRYAPAEPLLLKFVPRRYDLGPRSRGAAVWAFGHLHADDPQLELARLLAGRVADSGDIPVLEPVEVRTNAAVSLGRMKVPEAIEVLRIFYKKEYPGSRVREACGWALEQITGEDLPDPPTRSIVPAAGHLQPIEP